MSMEPPSAKQVPHARTFHGDTVIDEYAWLADKDDPDTIAYLTAENAYTEAVTAGPPGGSARRTAGPRPSWRTATSRPCAPGPTGRSPGCGP